MRTPSLSINYLLLLGIVGLQCVPIRDMKYQHIVVSEQRALT